MTAWIRFKRFLRFHYLRLRRLKDQPEPLARGVAFGFASGFGPFFGLGLVAAWAFAALFRGNRTAAVITAVLFKWAIPLFITANLAVGSLVWGQPLHHANVHDLRHAHFWKDMGVFFVTGSAINMVISYVVAYFPVLHWANQRRLAKRALQTNLE
ncbi:DUF2062 domain-containing protein [Heliobacterium gestii]|uniref:DUF2062 domain-containing protein n=1 Tax=Heliomicrobium gestii TaxID=2699 RepID=A0A845LFF8_HELGE|nr:DUF2062 domain-containing protein [Heliomicrobium gestii]MBM7866545.1 uncharacterized protein (DUF2062 family) [Heliomicrobium gestii]MZP43175.1 DUF2062 domain-containing protein [Heliomicrobium gestii]